MDELGLVDSKIVVEEVEELALHEVCRLGREVSLTRRLATLDAQKPLTGLGSGEQACIPIPILVLWARVIQVLRSHNKGGEKDAVAGAVHALCDFGQAALEALEVDERAEQRGDLDVGLFDQNADESLEAGQGQVRRKAARRGCRGCNANGRRGVARIGRRAVHGERGLDWRGRRRDGRDRGRAALDDLDGLICEVCCYYF